MDHTDPEIALRAARVELAVFDVDGVMTDGRIILDAGGREFKAFNVRDGHGLVMLGRQGIKRAVITGRTSLAVGVRMKELAIEYVYQGVNDKLITLESILETQGIDAENVCYVGDDEPDLAVMRMVGFPVAVADAEEPVRDTAIWVTNRGGGRGAVREVCELILEARERPGHGSSSGATNA